MAQISDSQKLFEYELGTALGIERKVQTMLKMMEGKAEHPELKQGFGRHLQETAQQIQNLEQALEAVGAPSTAHNDPIVDGIAEHAQQMLGRVDDSLVDMVLLGGAAHTEHHEIATYQGLITMASAMGQEDVVALLTENLEQELRTLNEVELLAQELAQRQAQVA